MLDIFSKKSRSLQEHVKMGYNKDKFILFFSSKKIRPWTKIYNEHCIYDIKGAFQFRDIRLLSV